MYKYGIIESGNLSTKNEESFNNLLLFFLWLAVSQYMDF